MGLGEAVSRAALLVLCLLLASCSPAGPAETKAEAGPELLETAAHWTIAAQPEGGFRYTVTDGESVLLEETLETRPVLSLLERYGRTTVRVASGGEARRERYVRLPEGDVTDWLEDTIAASVDRAACLALPEGEACPVVQVHDLWGGGPVRTFHVPFSETLPSEELIDYSVFGSADLILVYRDFSGSLETATLDLYGPDWEDNPIDRFYRRYSLPGSPTLEIALEASAYAQAWQAEAEHAYALLAERAVEPAYADMARDAWDALSACVPRQAKLEAWSAYSDAFEPEFYNASYGVIRGTGLPGFQESLRANLYREQVRALYTQYMPGTDLDERFVFDPEAYLSLLRDEYRLTVLEKQAS